MTWKVVYFSIMPVMIYYSYRLPENGKNKIIIILGVLLSSIMFYAWFSLELPRENELVKLQGKIIEAYRRNEYTNDIIFRLDSSPLKFEYLDWYPEQTEVEYNLQINNFVSIWYSNLDNTKLIDIWRLDRNGKTIISFSNLVESKKGNVKLALYMGIIFSLCVVFGIVREYNHKKSVAT